MEQYSNFDKEMDAKDHFKNRASLKSLSTKNFLRNVCVVLLAIFGSYNNNITAQIIIKNDTIKPYINFLENNKFLSAKDYILSKFETYDIVILSERHHADMTQYEVILDVVKDERFKGNIFTEVGVSNMSERINKFLLNSTLTKEEKESELLSIYRDIDFNIIWRPYNYYHLLSEIFEINKTRKEEDKIKIFPTDVAFDWNEYKTSGEYAVFYKLLDSQRWMDRDRIMGKNFVRLYERAKRENSEREKALVIQNTYHGYIRIPTYLPLPTKPDIYSTGEYIYKTYPDKTTNIYINFLRSGDEFKNLSNNGIIDAAFEYTQIDNIGFDLKNTPIGNTKFDLYRFGGDYETNVNFAYIFDGMIFYKPLKELVLKYYIPDIYPKEFEEQFFYRVAIVRNQTEEEAKNNEENISLLKVINNPVETSLDKKRLDWISEQIRKWVE